MAQCGKCLQIPSIRVKATSDVIVHVSNPSTLIWEWEAETRESIEAVNNKGAPVSNEVEIKD